MNELRDILKRIISLSACTQAACVFPTVLAEWPKGVFSRATGQTSADVAISYFGQQGFKSDRTRMNLRGYPGLFRELNEPPPWIEVTHEDVEGAVSDGRTEELQPLFRHACNASIPDLLNRYEEYLKERNAITEPLGINMPRTVVDFSLELLEEKLQLARCIGAEQFENIFEAVFDFDEFTPAAGAPDLFVWDPHTNIWFFAEVKGSHDHVRHSQAEWVRIHWDKIYGRFLLLVFAPDA